MNNKKRFFKNFRYKVLSYSFTNRLFLTYLILALFGVICIRGFTIGHALSPRATITDIGTVVLLGAFGYLKKPNKQYRYFMGVLCFITFLLIVNSIYYTFYTNFASLGELATLRQAETVTGSIFERLKLLDFIYLLIPFTFRYVHKKLLTTPYYNFLLKIENSRRMFWGTLAVGASIIGFRFLIATSSDYSRLAKLWNRESVVERFGIILYQANDVVKTLKPKISSLFGYEDALKSFKDYIEENEYVHHDNKYTNIFEGKNIIFVHMESIQTFLMNLNFNGEDVTPTINKLAKEGMFFSKFYPQISTGTSSDTEFTLLSSLMPAASGTIFVSYYDRDYVTIPKLLKAKGYATFSMHGNNAAMWNRAKVHPLLGYDKMYFKESFKFTEDDVINLGINDKLFYEQAIPILEKVEQDNKNYMGTVISLSNHSPFTSLDKYGEFDLSVDVEIDNFKTGKKEIIKTNYLEGTPVGNYIHSAHYADVALGDFIDYINESDYFNDTIFVFYGDHDAKLSRSNLEYLYDYDKTTGELLEADDPNYIEYDEFTHELNKNTPLIIWSKDPEVRSKINIQIDDVMGTFDIMPTIGNMFGFENKYALGHDVFDKNYERIVIYPNGNFLTNKVYYRNSTGDYKILKDNVILDEKYIQNYLEYTEKRLDISNDIITYNLLGKKAAKDMKDMEREND